MDELIEEVLVDAFGESEQLSSFECAFAEAELPVRARALGTLTGVGFDGDVRRGLEADLMIDGRVERVGILSVEVARDDRPEFARLLTAFRRWWVPAG